MKKIFKKVTALLLTFTFVFGGMNFGALPAMEVNAAATGLQFLPENIWIPVHGSWAHGVVGIGNTDPDGSGIWGYWSTEQQTAPGDYWIWLQHPGVGPTGRFLPAETITFLLSLKAGNEIMVNLSGQVAALKISGDIEINFGENIAAAEVTIYAAGAGVDYQNITHTGTTGTVRIVNPAAATGLAPLSGREWVTVQKQWLDPDNPEHVGSMGTGDNGMHWQYVRAVGDLIWLHDPEVGSLPEDTLAFLASVNHLDQFRADSNGNITGMRIYGDANINFGENVAAANVTVYAVGAGFDYQNITHTGRTGTVRIVNPAAPQIPTGLAPLARRDWIEMGTWEPAVGKIAMTIAPEGGDFALWAYMSAEGMIWLQHPLAGPQGTFLSDEAIAFLSSLRPGDKFRVDFSRKCHVCENQRGARQPYGCIRQQRRDR
jgi:hypothetical protein